MDSTSTGNRQSKALDGCKFYSQRNQMRRRRMAAAIWTFPLTLCCCLLSTSADASTACTHFAALGKSYNVPLDADLKPEHRIIWKHSSTTLYDSRYGDKNTHKVEKGSLILPKVTNDDGGSYTWEILDGTSMRKVNTNQVSLCVLESVSKPSVTFECDEKRHIVQFTCSGTPTQNVNFHWFEGSKVIANANAKILVRTFEQLGSNSFHCDISNKVSSLSSDPVNQGCLKPSEEENLLFGLNFWLMVGILAGGGGLVLALIVATIICCSINRRKRRLQIKDEQELRLQWSTGTNQHPHNHQYVNQRGHASRPTAGQNKAPPRDSAGNTGPRPPRARQNRPRPPDPITGQPLPGPRRLPETGHTQVPVSEEEIPPPLPQPRKTTPRRT